jgi:hypothetical protein
MRAFVAMNWHLALLCAMVWIKEVLSILTGTIIVSKVEGT